MNPRDDKVSGEDAARAGRLDEAIAAFNRVLAQNPADAESHVWLGQCLAAQGKTFLATKYLHAGGLAVLRQSGHAAQVLEIVQFLQRLGAPEQALEIARNLVAQNPELAPAWYALAASAAQLGHLEEACKAADEALTRSGGNHGAALLAASIACDAGNPETAYSRLQTLIEGGLTDHEAFRAFKELARSADRLGRKDEVFPALDRAAEHARQLTEFAAIDCDAPLRQLAANRAGLDTELARRWIDDGPADSGPAPTFITGFLRSGTTLMQEILAMDPAVLVSDEVPLVASISAALERSHPGTGSRIARLDALDRHARARLRQHYRALAVARLGLDAHERRLVDKFTLNLIDLPVILRLFPESPVIFMARDPRDSCLSALLQLMPLTPATANLLDLPSAASLCAAIFVGWQHAQTLPGFNGHTVRYESLVQDFRGTLQQLLPGIGIEWRADMHDFHRHASSRAISTPSREQVRKPISEASVGRWKAYSDEFSIVAETLAPALSAWHDAAA